MRAHESDNTGSNDCDERVNRTFPQIAECGVSLNVFRLFQRWKSKVKDSTKSDAAVSRLGTAVSSNAPAETACSRTQSRNSVPYQAASESTSRASAALDNAARWIEPGGTTTVAGRNIGGMVHLGPDRSQAR